MKKVLMIGKNSYISKNLLHHLLNRSNGYMVNTITARNEEWESLDFGMYDYIINFAGITPYSQEVEITEAMYYYINCDLAYRLALKAKEDGAGAFIYISTIKIFGAQGKIGSTIVIDKNTAINPAFPFEKSKLAGENKLKKIESDTFKITILRLPFIYGPDCSGEYAEMKKLLKSYKKLPHLKNKISAIHIATCCAFIQYLLDNDITGTFHPQNIEYLSTLELVNMISKEENVTFEFSKIYALKLKLFKSRITPDLHKLFGSIVYAKEIDL